MPPFPPIETTRLRLRRFAGPDLAGFLAYRNDPQVARYQSWDHTTEAEAGTFIAAQHMLEPGEPGEWFQIAIALKENDALVGDCGFKLEEDDPRQAEIGYTLARAHQGQGIATEAVTAVLEYLFGTLALHRVTATVDCANTPSFKLLERLGFRREGHFLQNVWFKGQWGDEYLYAMLGNEWRVLRSL